MHVLVCDDNEGIRIAVRRHLERVGCRVTEADEGSAALKVQANDAADVLVTDIIMPGTEGIETIRHFRQLYPNIRIVAMTGDGEGPYLEIAKHLGAAAVLGKPFSGAELIAAVGVSHTADQ